jgi:hypothetical protein
VGKCRWEFTRLITESSPSLHSPPATSLWPIQVQPCRGSAYFNCNSLFQFLTITTAHSFVMSFQGKATDFHSSKQVPNPQALEPACGLISYYRCLRFLFLRSFIFNVISQVIGMSLSIYSLLFVFYASLA